MHTYAEYLAVEEASEVRHEFRDGQIYRMSDSTPEHSALSGAVLGSLYRRDGCRGYTCALRVRTPSGLATHPDGTFVCGPTERDSEDGNAVTNPSVIIEVLSPETEQYDRGEKFEHYKSFASLRQVLFVSHRERAVEVWSRGEVGWSRVTARDGETAELVIGARLNVSEIYEAARL